MRRSLIVLAALAAACGSRDRRPDAAQMERDTVPVLVGAGDVADCRNGFANATAAILDTVKGSIFIAGDVAYATRRNPDPLFTCFAPMWGRHLARIHPAPGNHEYIDGSADRYFDYFGARAGTRPGGYYSYQLGDWHVLALNTNVAFDSLSPQGSWLRQDIAANGGRCTVAYMHHPRFSSGPHKDHDRIAPLWNTLAEHGVSVVIAGHDHIYERFAPLDTAGKEDVENGMRQFVVGTGGASSYEITRVAPGSEVRASDAYGLLKLTLLTDRYRWEFIPVDPEGFRDSGESSCRTTHAAR